MKTALLAFSLIAAAAFAADAPPALIQPDTRIHVGYEDAKWSESFLKMARLTRMTTSADVMIAAFTAKGVRVTLVPNRQDADYIFVIAGGSQNVSNGYVARTVSGRYSSSTRVYEDVSRSTEITAKLIDPRNANAVVWAKTYSGGKSDQAASESIAKAFAEWINGK